MIRPTGRPLPVPDEHSEGYWTAAAQHTLALPRCAHCHRFAFPPEVVCPNCLSTDPQYEYLVVSGAGTVRTWTVISDAFVPGFEDDTPFVLVDVELDAQPDLRMLGRLTDGVDAPLHLGDRVVVTFEDIAAGVSIPAFHLDAGA